MTFYDSHCHLNDPQYDVAAELELCRRACVGALMVVGTTLQDSRRALEIALQYGDDGPALGASCGLHPEEIAAADDDWGGQLEALLSHPCCLALGEVGMDYHWHPFNPAAQARVLETQWHLAIRHKKPVIFHLRDCHAAFRDFVKAMPPLPCGAVMHCFGGTKEDAAFGLDRGWYVGFTGAITFKRADALREVAAYVPTDRILSETDCPYMAPVPHRGKVNHPAWVEAVCRCLAQVKGVSVQAMADAVCANGAALFGLEVKHV